MVAYKLTLNIRRKRDDLIPKLKGSLLVALVFLNFMHETYEFSTEISSMRLASPRFLN